MAGFDIPLLPTHHKPTPHEPIECWLWNSLRTVRHDVYDIESKFASVLKTPPQRDTDVFPTRRTIGMPTRAIPPAVYGVTLVRDEDTILQWSCVRDIHPIQHPQYPFPSAFHALHTSLLDNPLVVLHRYTRASSVLQHAPSTILSRFNVFQDAVQSWACWRSTRSSRSHNPYQDGTPAFMYAVSPTDDVLFPSMVQSHQSLDDRDAMTTLWTRVCRVTHLPWKPSWWDPRHHALDPTFSCVTAIVFRLFVLDQLHKEHIQRDILRHPEPAEGIAHGRPRNTDLFNLGVAMDMHIPLALRLGELAESDAHNTDLVDSGLYLVGFPHHDNPNQPPHLFNAPCLRNILYTFRRPVPSSVAWLQCMISKLRPVVLPYRRLAPSIANKCVRFLQNGCGFQMNVTRSFVLTSMMGNIPWATWIAPLGARLHMQRIFFPDARNGWDRALYWIVTRNTHHTNRRRSVGPSKSKATPTFSNEHPIVLCFYETLIASSYLLPALHYTLCSFYDWYAWGTTIFHVQEHARRLLCSISPAAHADPARLHTAIQRVFHIIRHCFGNIKTSILTHVFRRYAHAAPHNKRIKSGMGGRMSGRNNKAKHHKRVEVVRSGVLKLPKIYGIFPIVISITKRAVAALKTAGLYTEDMGDILTGYVSGAPSDTQCLQNIRNMVRPGRAEVMTEINKMTKEGMGIYKIMHLVHNSPLEIFRMPPSWGIHQESSLRARHNVKTVPRTMSQWAVCLSCSRVCREVVTTAHVFHALFTINPAVARQWRRSFYVSFGGNHINATPHAQTHLNTIRHAVLTQDVQVEDSTAGSSAEPQMLTGDFEQDTIILQQAMQHKMEEDEFEVEGADDDDDDDDMNPQTTKNKKKRRTKPSTRRPKNKSASLLFNSVDLGGLDIEDIGMEMDLSGLDLDEDIRSAAAGFSVDDGTNTIEESDTVRRAKERMETTEDQVAADILLAQAQHGPLDEDDDVLWLERRALGKNTGVVGANTNSKRKSDEHIRNISNQGMNNVSIGPCSACGGLRALLGPRPNCRTCQGQGIQYRCNFKIDINTTTTHAKPHCWARLHFVPALGTLMYLRNFIYFICPEPGCGIHARMDARILNRGRIQCAWCHFKAWRREQEQWTVPLLRPMILNRPQFCMKCGCSVPVVDVIHNGVSPRKLVGAQKIPRPPQDGGHCLPLTDPHTGNVSLHTVCAACWKPVLLHVDLPTYTDDMSRILSYFRRRARSHDIQRRILHNQHPSYLEHALAGQPPLVAASSRNTQERSLASRVQEFTRISTQTSDLLEGSVHDLDDADHERVVPISEHHLHDAIHNTLNMLE